MMSSLKRLEVVAVSLSKHLAAARRRKPAGPSASPALNNVERWATKKIIFSLASRRGWGN